MLTTLLYIYILGVILNLICVFKMNGEGEDGMAKAWAFCISFALPYLIFIAALFDNFLKRIGK